jgi:hypothetical protein
MGEQHSHDAEVHGHEHAHVTTFSAARTGHT